MKRRTRAEPSGYVEIGTYLFNRPGKSSVKTLTSVNSPIKLETADEIKQIKKIRVETRVLEDKSVEDGKVYQKDVETIQISDDDGDVKSSDPTTSSETPVGENPGTPWDDFKKWTKNIIDKQIDTNNLQWVVIGASLVLGALALGGVLLAR